MYSYLHISQGVQKCPTPKKQLSRSEGALRAWSVESVRIPSKAARPLSFRFSSYLGVSRAPGEAQRQGGSARRAAQAHLADQPPLRSLGPRMGATHGECVDSY